MKPISLRLGSGWSPTAALSHLLLAAACAVCFSGCLSGLNHPLRAESGVYATVAGGVMVPAGRIVGCHAGCRVAARGEATGPVFELGVGAMAEVSDSFALLGGLYTPGVGNQRGNGKNGGGLVGTVHAFYQTPSLALGAGAEAGSRLWAFKLTADKTVGDDFHIGLWSRVSLPWTTEAGELASGPEFGVSDGFSQNLDVRVGGSQPAIDIGVRVGTSHFAVNYTVGYQFDALGSTMIPLEGVFFAEFMHVISLSYAFVLPWNHHLIQGR